MSTLASVEDQLALAEVERLGWAGVGAVSQLLALLVHHTWSVRRAVVAALSRGGERFGTDRGLCPNAERAYERILTLPLFPSMSDEDVDYVAQSLAWIVENHRR